MGYRKIPTIHTLDKIPGEEGLVVRMKSVSFGKVRRLLALLDREDSEEGSMDEIASRFVDALVSWNLEDSDGNPVPTTADGVDDQDFDFVMKLVNAWLSVLSGPDEELGKGSSSGGKFPGQPLTMEAL